MHVTQLTSTAESPASAAMPRGLLLIQMRHLVDLVTQHVTESSMVLGTETIDALIARSTVQAETTGNEAEGAASYAGLARTDAPHEHPHATPATSLADPAGPPAGFTSWREAAESERAPRFMAQRQRGMARAELHAVCELLKYARQSVLCVVTQAANLASEVSRQEAIAQLDAALAIRHTIPVPGSSGALAPLTLAALDSFVGMDLMSSPDAEDDAFGFLETPSEMALRAIASYLGVGGLLDFVAMIFEGGGNHDVSIGFLRALEKVEARLIPADARPAARLTVTAEAEGGEPKIVEVTVLSKFPVGTHELHALPSRVQIPIVPSDPEPLVSSPIET